MAPDSMNRPIYSSLVALGLFVLGSMTMPPAHITRRQIGLNGTVTLRTKTEMRIEKLRVYGLSYLCLTGAAASFAWTVYLIGAEVVHQVRTIKDD